MKGFSTHQTTSPLKGKKAKAARLAAADQMKQSAAAHMEKMKSSMQSTPTNILASSPAKSLGAILGEAVKSTVKEGGKAVLKEGAKTAVKEGGKAVVKEAAKKTLKGTLKKAGGKALESAASTAGSAVVNAAANKLTKKKEKPERRAADMSGFSSQQYGTPMRKASPAKGKKWDAFKKGAKKAGRAAYDKASQVGMGLKASLYAESDGTRGSGIIATAKRGYNREKKADQAMRAKQREKEALGYVIPTKTKKKK